MDAWDAHEFRGGLVVVTLESNFDGRRLGAAACARVVAAARAAGAWTLVDAAKAAATGPVDVAALGSPDFAALSLYKLFGAPTGLGCLVATRRGVEALRAAKAAGGHHVGGGAGGTQARNFGRMFRNTPVPNEDRR